MFIFKENEPIIFLEKHNNPLICTKTDLMYYREVLKYVNEDRCHYSAIIKNNAHKMLYKWILDKTKKLVDTDEFQYQMSTRVFWILDGLTDFPICTHPNCTNKVGIRKNVSLRPIHGIVGYPLYCSATCMNSSPIVKEHRRLANLKKI